VNTTIDAIASSAQVSAKTVEAVFGSKRGVLRALVDPLASAGPPRDLIDQIRAAADPVHRLELIAKLCRRVYEASQPEFELVRGAAAVVPEVEAVAAQMDTDRLVNQTRVITYLRDQRRLREDLTEAEATDIIWSLTSYDLYRALVTRRRWTAGRYQSWLAHTIVASLLAEPGGQREEQHIEDG